MHCQAHDLLSKDNQRQAAAAAAADLAAAEFASVTRLLALELALLPRAPGSTEVGRCLGGSRWLKWRLNQDMVEASEQAVALYRDESLVLPHVLLLLLLLLLMLLLVMTAMQGLSRCID
ncbi:hypothetical protein Emed_007378 [Eimeria media]